ncbi:fructose-6-phosphate aldolase [Thermosediminibacter litoriperuensis]|uniref:Probable transaldolase n=1 Tax=Thermosediminibacter litoriperuensis TaxID=291989 RepID=A0A5S5AW71_9FIRM|nr:fructose-6-phosphate aldolase [Thermosediminibacter litoriperuensis]TYP56777.1 transaldolase [Thermosediminibacter litoriperuensis]
MKLFLDTANVAEIREAAALGVISGVTTNPTLVAKEGRDFKETILEITGNVDGPISAEVVSLDARGMIEEAMEIASWHPNIVIKIPMIWEGLKAVKELSKKGIKTNVTLVFSPSQALLAARAGATYVSPFVGRFTDISQDGIGLISDIADIFTLHDIKTEIIAASIRTPMDVVNAAKAGADIATVPYKVLEQMVKHPLTDIGVQRFLEDWKKVPKKQ